jgi:hypothetical protein
LPSEIANLPALSSLNLMRNRLIELPKSVWISFFDNICRFIILL